MAYVQPVVADFKAQFQRDFRFAVPGFGATGLAAVAGGAVTGISVVTGGLRYQSSAAVTISGGGGTGAVATATVGPGGVITGFTVTAPGTGYTTPPTVSIDGGGDPTDTKLVTDADIVSAIALAANNVNPALFQSQAQFTQVYNYAAAHYLVTNLQNSSQGLRSSAEWLTASKSAGSLAQSFNIPDRVLRSPLLSLFSKTAYGQQYLSIIAPLLVGNIGVDPRCSLP